MYSELVYMLMLDPNKPMGILQFFRRFILGAFHHDIGHQIGYSILFGSSNNIPP